jgi:hypothetical protein
MKQPVQYRSASAATQHLKDLKAPQVELAAAQPAQVSFASDIMPLFKQFQGPMMWRFDLASYDAVKDNAKLIFDQISTKSMPPPPFPPLTDEQIATFAAWMKEGYPP